MRQNIWQPLTHSAYRAFWVCAFLSNLGTWIQDVANGWVMTHLNTSPLVISLLSFSSSLPVMLFAIPAGIIADMGHRRNLLLFAQTMMFIAAGLIGFLVWKNLITEWSLLILTLTLGLGFALTNPAFQSVLTDLVPNTLQVQAVLVYYLGINLTRVLGPSLGGLFLGSWGPASAFLFNSISFLGLILFFWKWPLQGIYDAQESPEKSKIKMADLRGLFNLSSGLLWVEIFFVTFFASSLWALYPTRGRIEVVLNTWQYGSLLACLGAGACISAVFSKKIFEGPHLKFFWSLSYLIYALGVITLALSTTYWHLCLAMTMAGVGWLVFTTAMNMQTRSRIGSSNLRSTQLAVFLTVFYAGMSFGSVNWGAIANVTSTSVALGCAGTSLLLIGFVKFQRTRIRTSPRSIEKST